MHRQRHIAILFLCITLLTAPAVCGQINDFDDGTLQGWSAVGARPPSPLVTMPGPSAAASDLYFEVTDRASIGNIPGLNVLASDDFLGDYTPYAQSCATLELDVRVLDDQGGELTFQINFANDPDGFLAGDDPLLRARFVLDEVLDENDGWTHVSIPLALLDANGDLPSNAQGSWEMIVGGNQQWNGLLAEVDLVYLPLEINNGTFERIGLDNVELVASECPCGYGPMVPRQGGIADGFTPPADVANRSPQLEQAVPGVQWKNFDEPTLNRALGHSFSNLPAGILEAELEIRMRPEGNSGQFSAGNDSLSVGLEPGNGFLFSSRISALPGTGGTWGKGVNSATTFTFDLGSMPDGSNLLPRLTADGRLDVYVQDDTNVDLMVLRLRPCPPPRWIDGTFYDTFAANALPNLLGGVELTPAGDDRYGIEFDLNGAQGFCAAVNRVCLGTEGLAIDLAIAGKMVDLQNPLDGVEGVLSLSTQLPDVLVSVEFEEPFHVHQTVEVLNGDGNTVLTVENNVNGPTALLPADACVQEFDFLGRCFQVLLTDPVEITVLKTGEKAVGDRLKICRTIIPGMPDAARWFVITARNLPEFSVTGGALEQFDMLHSAVGDAVLSATERSLVLSNLDDGGDDGVALHVGDREAAYFEMAPPKTRGDGPAVLEASAIGDFDGSADVPLGSLRVVHDGDAYKVSADFSEVGAETQRVQVYENGRLRADLGGLVTPEISTSGWPDELGKTFPVGQTKCFAGGWPAGSLFTVGGTTYRGDELRVLAEGTAGAVGAISRLELRTAGVERLTLTGARASGKCEAGDLRLCLNQERFEVAVDWTDYQGDRGSGIAVPLTADTGYFWFFRDSNVELVVKVLDGRTINDAFWVFYAALSNVEYELTVTDKQTGQSKRYLNPAGRFASVGDTGAFPQQGGAAGAASRVNAADVGATAPLTGDLFAFAHAVAATPAANGTCAVDGGDLCLAGDRFRVEAEWVDFAGKQGSGVAVPITDDTGYFWFFRDTNVELAVKVLDGRAVNGNWWVFYGALSNVEYTITVTDTLTGSVKTYANPGGTFASRGDTAAFDG